MKSGRIPMAVAILLAACGDDREAGIPPCDVLALPEVEVWAVGPHGAIWHRGDAWQAVDSPTVVDLRAVRGSAADDVWAVGGGGTIIHWDGSRWSGVPSGVDVDLRDVAASADDDAWAVGDGGTIIHWDGAAWSEVASGTTDDLLSVWAGDGEAFVGGPIGAVMRWDGTAGWQIENISTRPVVVRHLDGLAPTELWAIGDESALCFDCGSDECMDCFDDSVLRRTADGWQEREVDGTGDTEIRAVAALSEDEVWLATQTYCRETRGVVGRLSGRAWSVEGPDVVEPRALWGALPDAVWLADDEAVWRRTADGWLVESGPGRVHALWGPAVTRSECDPDPDLGGEAVTLDNPCFGVTCEGGLCDSLDSDGACLCPEGLHAEGRTCVVDDACTGVTCSERGACVVVGDASTCDCEDGLVDQGGTLCGQLPGDGTCSDSGWCIVSPLPTADTDVLLGWGTGDVWAGAFAHRTASGWQRLDLGIEGQLIGLDGSGPGDVWFLTETEIYHWDGTSTARVPFDCSFGAHGERRMDHFLHLAAAQPGEVWVSGERLVYSYPGLATGACRFDGRRWHAAGREAIDTAWGVCAGGGSCTDVFAAAPGEVWCGASLRWDGTRFVPLAAELPGPIQGVWGASADDVWAISGYRIHHFDGTSWSDAGVGLVAEIDGAAAGDVWAVGDEVWHFDGDSWRSRGALVSDLPYYLGRDVAALGGGEAIVGIGGHLYHYTPGGRVDEAVSRPGGAATLWGASADDLWLGGRDGLWRWNGTGWARVRLSSVDRVGRLSGLAADDIWAAAVDRDDVSQLGHFDGSGWTVTRAIDLDLGNAPSVRHLHAVSARAADEVWIGGVELSPARGFIAWWNGTRWRRIASPGEVQALWPGDGEVWALVEMQSGSATARWRPGAGWTTLPLPEGVHGSDVFGFAADDVWAVGNLGTILHFDGATWSEVPSGTGGFLRHVWGASPDDVWAAGDGVLLHWNGSAWSPVSLPPGVALSTVFGVDGVMWAGGNYLLRRQ